MKDMALVPAGEFNYSDNPLVASSVCTVGAFWMDRHEISWKKWASVYKWALANGYAFDNPGDKFGVTHPVHTVNWYDCVKWCNARSEKEGLTPCYYANAKQAEVYRAGRLDIGNDCVKWTANGYRLPTEAEWEKAARGGSNGNRFPWSNSQDISHKVANYYSTDNYEYDISQTRGYHPNFGTGTSPVGSFAPNGYGLYDMAGNVWEWCWDWYGETYPVTLENPLGPLTGTRRVLRGGSWDGFAFICRSAIRYGRTPGDRGDNFGFRTVRF